MSMDRSRRERFSTVAPTSGEVALGVTLAGVFLVVVTPLVVQGVVGVVAAGQWVWPNGTLWTAYAGLLRGEFGAGVVPAVAANLPPHPVMWVLTVVGEVLVFAAAAVVWLWVRDLTGSGSKHGLATAAAAAEALGLLRLHKSAAVIRPDLYGRQPVTVDEGREPWPAG